VSAESRHRPPAQVGAAEHLRKRARGLIAEAMRQERVGGGGGGGGGGGSDDDDDDSGGELEAHARDGFFAGHSHGYRGDGGRWDGYRDWGGDDGRKADGPPEEDFFDEAELTEALLSVEEALLLELQAQGTASGQC